MWAAFAAIVIIAAVTGAVLNSVDMSAEKKFASSDTRVR